MMSRFVPSDAGREPPVRLASRHWARAAFAASSRLVSRSVVVCLLLLSGCAAFTPTDPAPGLPRTVAAVDVQRYLGTWYEIARIPASFQDSATRRCADVTATYTARPDGRIDVLNACRNALDNYAETSARAVASAVPGGNNARLRVQFFWPFSGDYWVIGLDPEYRWALVGAPSRNFLWLLSRTPTLPEPDIAAAFAIAAREGFDTARIVRTEQRPR
jgi:apolipoprotein D and lipocalin family protein